eukprot:5564531-Pyramimonas_sp.AAC.1
MAARALAGALWDRELLDPGPTVGAVEEFQTIYGNFVVLCILIVEGEDHHYKPIQANSDH